MIQFIIKYNHYSIDMNQIQKIVNDIDFNMNKDDINVELDGLGDYNKNRAKAIEKMEMGVAKVEKLFDLEAFQLHDLHFMNDFTWHTLETINISRNHIISIDILNNFQSLRVINASFCDIEEVQLKLPRLEKLDLSSNYLKTFPILANMRKLKYLNLSTNKLVDFKQLNIDFTPSITHLNVSNNPTLVFEAKRDFVYFMAKLKKLNLESFDIDNTVIKNFNGMDEIIKQLPKLKTINGNEKDNMQRKLNRAKANKTEMQEDDDLEDEQSEHQLEVKGFKKNRLTLPPNLKNLIFSLEAANSHPSQALLHLKQLTKDADKILDKLEIVEINFATNMEDIQIDEAIETFMQNAYLLIDNHHELQSIILTVLAKLSIVRFHDFGLHCFNTLKDLMKSGRQMETQVIYYLQAEVINKMKQHDPTVIPVSLLRGLYELILDSGKHNLLSGMFDQSFPQWLRLYNEKIDFCKRQGTMMGNHDHFDAIIQLLSVSVSEDKDDENVQRMLDTDIYKKITTIIKNSSWIHNRYIPCLLLITTLANASPKVADQFMDTYVHTNLINQIKKSIGIYKKNQSLFDESTRETLEVQKLKYETLSSEIITLGSLLQSESKENRMKILEEPIVVDLIEIMSHEKTDPLLLTAICRFALNLFSTNEVRLKQDLMEQFYQGTSSMRQIIPYLGFDKYPVLLAMSKKYHTIGKMQTRYTEASDESDDDDPKARKTVKDSTESTITSSMSHLNDPIVIELFIRIINLIEFFCRQAVENTKNKLFEQIAENLNSNNRETALFNCLMVPDDGVRLAVVRCLFVVPEDQFDSEELYQICKIMGTCVNIGAGQTELVLSTIYWILTKFVLGDPKESNDNVYKTFQMKFGDQSINEALNILNKNLIRITEVEDEDEEKYALSMSIINFLKASSKAPLMFKYMRQKTAIFKKILIAEDLFSSAQVCDVPIDIENTMIGRDVNCLMETLQGVQTLHPYCDVSLRVIMRIADALQAREYVNVYPIDQAGNQVSDKLLKFQTQIYKKKKKRELSYWVDKPENFVQTHVDDMEEFIYNHEAFTNHGSGIGLLKIFLSAKFSRDGDYLEALCSPEFDHIRIQKEDNKKSLNFIIEMKKRDLERKLCSKYGVEKDKDNKFRTKNKYAIREQMWLKYQQQNKQIDADQMQLSFRDLDCSPEEMELMKQTRPTNQLDYYSEMQFEMLGHDFKDFTLKDEQRDIKQKIEDKLRDDHMMEIKKNNQENNQFYFKDKRGDGFLNKSHRILTVAAFLRCLYGAIEYAPNMRLKMEAINNIKNDLDTFASITRLCDACDWDESANIGAKYLRIMRHVIRIPNNREKEDFKLRDSKSGEQDHLIYYQIISVVIQKILSKIVDKIQKDIQLTDHDQITIYELSYTFYVVVNQANNFKFSDFSLVKLHIENERSILTDHGMQKELEDEKKPYFQKNASRVLFLKCEREDFEPVNRTLKDHIYFRVQMADIYQKRSIQSKLVEHLVLNLFSKKSVFSLVDILFKDMYEDFRFVQEMGVLDDEEEMEDQDEESHVHKKGNEDDEQESSEDEEVDPNKYGQDIDLYMQRKGILTIERIKDIVGEFMANCPNSMNYEIIEYIMRNVVYETKKLRESFLQEILHAHSHASFTSALETYINENNFTIKSNRYERVIMMVNCDINRTLSKFNIDDIIQPKIENAINKNYLNRLFVLTSKGIHVMEPISEDLKCMRCQTDKFCPKGPMPVYQVSYEDIETIIKFPQIPQKICIVYSLHYSEKDEIQKLKFQMTLNIPTYTMSSKIYIKLREILSQVNMSKSGFRAEKIQKKYDSRQAMIKKSNKSQVPINSGMQINDIYSQFCLRNLLMFDDKSLKKKNIIKMDLIMASLMSLDRLPDRFTKDEFQRLVSPKMKELGKNFEDVKIKDNPNHPNLCKLLKKYVDSCKVKTEEKNFIRNNVLIGIAGSKIYILKEQWVNWRIIERSQDLKMIIRDKANKIQEAEAQQLKTFKTNGHTPGGPTPGFTPGGGTPDGSKMGQKGKVMTELFELIVSIHIPTSSQLLIHKGKDPSIEMKFKDGLRDNKIKILFPGDMERQKFIEEIIRIKKNKNLEDEDGEKTDDNDDGQDEDDEDPRKENNESDEEPAECIIYD